MIWDLRYLERGFILTTDGDNRYTISSEELGLESLLVSGERNVKEVESDEHNRALEKVYWSHLDYMEAIDNFIDHVVDWKEQYKVEAINGDDLQELRILLYNLIHQVYLMIYQQPIHQEVH